MRSLRTRRDFPGHAIFLIDTYDTERAARTVVDLAGKLEPEGLLPRAVRLDSGDINALSRSVRAILDDGGLTAVQIFASGDLDEYRIEELMAAGAPIDAFGVGTQLGTSGDAPHVRGGVQARRGRERAEGEVVGGQGDVAGSQAGVPERR